MAVLGPTLPHGRTCLGVDGTEDAPLAWSAVRKRRTIAFTRHPAGTPAAGTPVAAALPVHSTFLRRLRAPFSSVAKAEKVWPALLDIQLPFPLDSAVYRFLAPVRTADGQVETLAVAIRREDLAAWQARWQAAGFAPWVADHEGLALWSRSGAEQPLEKKGFRMVCYVGLDRIALAWGQGPDLLAASGLRLGARELFDPERGEAATRQWAQRSLQFLRAQPRPDGSPFQWAWCGPGAARPDQVQRLAAPLGDLPGGTFFTHRDAESLLARAVAARALRPEPTATSLLPDDLAPPALLRQQQARRQRPLLAWAAAALVLLGINLGWTQWLNHRREALQQAVQARAADLAGPIAMPRGQEVLVAERALKEQAPTFVPFRTALSPSLLISAQSLLQDALDLGLTLDQFSLGEKAFLCSGLTTNGAAGEKLVKRLEKAGWVADWTSGKAGPDEPVPFALKASR